MTTWGEFKQDIRTGVLQDDNDRVSADLLYIGLQWAQRALCAHTAPVRYVAEADFTGTDLTLPTDVYDEFGLTAQVAAQVGSASPKLYKSVYHTPGATLWTQGDYYVERPKGTLIFNQSIATASTIHIYYFGTYSEPTSADEDAHVLEIPSWAEAAVAYMIGSHVLSGRMYQRSLLGQWSQKPENGNPEDNPFLVQQQWMLSVIEREMARVPKQDRENYSIDRYSE